MLLGFHLLSEGKRLRINVVGEDVLTVSVPLKRSMLDLPLKRGLYGAAFPLNCRCLCRTLLHSDAHAESRLLLISSHQLAPLLHTRPSQLRLTELDPRPELEDRFGSSCYTSQQFWVSSPSAYADDTNVSSICRSTGTKAWMSCCWGSLKGLKGCLNHWQKAKV